MNTIGKGILVMAIATVLLVAVIGNASANGVCVGANYNFSCGMAVNESCTFNATMTCPAGHGLVIGANNITIDGTGYTLDGVSSGACGDLGVQRSGIYGKSCCDIEIKDLEIKNFCNGIYLRYTEDDAILLERITIDNCEVHHNGGDTGGDNSVHGIKAIGVFDSVIKNCKIHDNIGKGDSCEGGGNGIFLMGISSYGAWDNIITENEIYDNKKGGFFTKMMCKDTEVSYNKLWGNGQGGIILRCMKTETHTIEYNNASANYGSGIFVGGPNNTIRYNIASYNKNGSEYSGGGIGPDSGSPGKYGMGICMGRSDGSHNNEIHSNYEVCGNEGVDIEVCPACEENTGGENTCNTTYNYDDAGATGCTYSCAPAGSAVTVINNCNFNANVPGGYYVLGGNLTCSGSEHGIIIGADGVVIDGYNETDGKYYWIDGGSPGAGAWSGIYNYNATLGYGYDNAVIKNLDIRNFYNGVMLAGSGSNPVVNNTIYNCEIHHNGDDGVGYSSHGIKMLDVSESVVRNCKIYNNTGAGDSCEAGGNGFFVKGPAADYNLITNNSIYNNRKGGYFTKMMCDHTNISYNKVWGNGQGGIILRCIKSEYHVIEQNEVTENSGLGIYIGGPSNTIRYNTVTNTTDDSPYGLGRGVGIDIERSGVDNTLISNTVCGNDKRDMVVNEGLTGNTGYDNICDTTTDYNDTGAGATGCAYACPCEGYYITVCKSGGECNSTTIQGGLNKVCRDGIVYVEDGISAVYDETTAVTKDNVTLNCNGATIKGAGAGIGVKILGKNGVIVNNCVVQNHSSGIYIGDGSSNCQMTNITAKFNANGFHLDGAIGNQLQNNTANANANGFYLYNSDENQLQNNTVNGNDKGFYLYRSDSNQFQGNIVNANADGFHLYRVRYNQIYDNRVEDNTGYGINCSYDVVANKIYNNLFKNTENVTFGSAIGVNYWNTGRQEGDRIFSLGNEIGGNYWTNPTGNGYSDVCVDADKNGFCDVPYELTSDNVDNLPLSDEYSAPAGICGDVNEDEGVDMLDVIDLLYYVSYPGEYTIGSAWAADVNCDDSINMLDVIDLLYYVSYPGEYGLGCCEG
ncbi:MAG TPA: hypothetical protein C5S37_01720 [Methanophagales archaeon]|nr:hypothetical protein [Methanophagales archaeon]